MPLCGRRHTGELEFARDPGLQYCYPQVCYFVLVRVPCKTARWAVDFTGAHCGHVIQPWKLGFQPYLLTGGPSGPVPGWLPCFPGPLRRLSSVAAGPPAGGRATTCILRPWGRTLRFLLRNFPLFPVCWCRSPTSTIEAPVSVDTLAPDSLSQQVYSRVRQSLAGAIAQPRPCATLRFNPAAQTIQPCCKGEAEHRVLETRFFGRVYLVAPKASVLSGLGSKTLHEEKHHRKKALRGRPSPTYSASSVYEILWNCPVSGLSS